MTHPKTPERRTFRQDRFDILIKRQKAGTATFNELTELDDLVNRDPELREKVIMENILMEENRDGDGLQTPKDNTVDPLISKPVHQNLLIKIRTFLSRLFLVKTGKTVSFRTSVIALV